MEPLALGLRFHWKLPEVSTVEFSYSVLALSFSLTVSPPHLQLMEAQSVCVCVTSGAFGA